MNKSNEPQVAIDTDNTKSEQFSQFINAYAVSWGANHFLSVMDSEQRIAFFIAISKTYPDEWKNAIIALANRREPDNAHPVGGCSGCGG